MDQHPVPQNISSYEFRLVGDMTLKQFFQLAGGVAAGLILYRTNLPFLIKYPLIFLAVLIGIMLAFVPVGGRPFSQWLMAFIKAIYSPTQFVWNPTAMKAEPIENLGITPTPSKTSPLDKFEQQLFDRFTTIFKGQPITVSAAPPAPSFGTNMPVASTPTPVPEVAPIVVPKHETMMSTMTQVTPPSAPAPTPVVATAPQAAPEPPVQPAPTPTAAPLVADVPVTVSYTPRPTINRTPEQAKLARFATNMPEPGQANILVGQASDDTGLPVEGVIIEIAEAATDIPVRALRTNRLGQFQIATPLTSGKYVLHFEKDNFAFESVSFVAEGKIIPPILVVGHAVTT